MAAVVPVLSSLASIAVPLITASKGPSIAPPPAVPQLLPTPKAPSEAEVDPLAAQQAADAEAVQQAEANRIRRLKSSTSQLFGTGAGLFEATPNANVQVKKLLGE